MNKKLCNNVFWSPYDQSSINNNGCQLGIECLFYDAVGHIINTAYYNCSARPGKL